MVGHTGSLPAAIIGVETVDLALARLIPVCEECGVTLIVTADHGNADEMLEKDKKGNLALRTAHSLNKVPFIIYDKEKEYKLADGGYGLANVAPTLAKMFGLEAPGSWEQPMI
jgi:2,3-bisphosphoglycerate-independent phosphoglycerate mutase